MTLEIILGFLAGLGTGAVILGAAVLATSLRDVGDDWDSY